MNDIKRLLKNCVPVFLLLFISLGVKADDTDIFLGQTQGDKDASANVLFILDNSESMKLPVIDKDGNPTSVIRIDALKQAFSQVIKTVEGVNAGLMRFDVGASVMYPVVSLNGTVTQSFFTASSEMFTGNDDAEETSVNGQVNTTNGLLNLGFVPVSEGVSAPINVRVPILAEDDDREENNAGVKIDVNQMNFLPDQINGLRYRNLGIPKNAQIIDARLQFYSPINHSVTNPTTIEIRGQAADNPAIFSGANNDLKNRWQSQSTAAKVDWLIGSAESWNVGEWHESANIAPIIQEIVNRSDWDANDALVLILKHQSGDDGPAGTLYRNNTPATKGPEGRSTHLKITYTVDTVTQSPTRVGLRFENVYLPKNAPIKSAYLEMGTTSTNGEIDNLELEINVEAAANASEYSPTIASISGRSTIPMKPVTWHPDPTWPAWVTVKSPDISSLLQELVNRSDWCGNNALALQIRPTSNSPIGSRQILSRDDPYERRPRLVVNYLSPQDNPGDATVGCVNEILQSRAKDVPDDSIREAVDGKMSTDLQLITDNWYGLRFKLNAKKNATIQSAHLNLVADYNRSSAQPGLNMTVWGEAANNSAAFTRNQKNLSRRNLTQTQVNWQTTSWDASATYNSPNIAPILQEIVNRPDWKSGNMVSLLFKSNTSLPVYTYVLNGGVTTKVLENNPELGIYYGSENNEVTTTRPSGTFTDYPRIEKANRFKGPLLTVKVGFGGADASRADLASVSIRQMLDGMVQNLNPIVATPITDSLYEAQQYFASKPVHFGLSRDNSRLRRVSHPDSYTTGASHNLPLGCNLDDMDSDSCKSESISGDPEPKYKSPITSNCQTNHIVLLTDGAATGNQSTDLIKTLINQPSCPLDNDVDNLNPDEQCARNLVDWMANNNVNSAFTASKIRTHTIAYNLSHDGSVQFLQALSAKGKGTYNTASSAGELAAAFEKVLTGIVSNDGTFTAAGVSVNQFNRLTNRNELYFSVFRPSAKPRWSGNLKRYQLGGDPIEIQDQLNSAAVSTETGFFKKDSRSFWSLVNDGDNVTLGGAASLLTDPVKRLLLTYLTDVDRPNRNLTNAKNLLVEENAAITNASLNATTNTERSNLLKWVRGYAADEDGNILAVARQHMGDPLHSSPAVVTYGGTETDPDTTIFVGTNEGFLHAFDAKEGKEQFAFMPADLLKQIKPQMENKDTQPHLAGMDGSPVIWRKNNNPDNDPLDHQIDIGEGDFVYLYTGMRRGGRDYYALDVSDRTQPKMLWPSPNTIIQGGSGDFAALGQSWSTPVKARLKIGVDVKDVLLFAGGFDPVVDDHPTQRIEVTMGNAIYMVDAKTGERLWMAGKSVASSVGLTLTDMKYAIPSNLEVVDVDKDGLADQFYVGDLGGQIWRFDIQHGISDKSQLIKGGVIANFAGAGASAGVDANNRRFFFKPDISFAAKEGELRLVLAIGSGSLVEPLSHTTHDRFYTLFLPGVNKVPDYANLTPVTEANLVDRTDTLDAEPIGGYAGWYIRMEGHGEKVLAPSLSVNHQVIFTTYTPNEAVSECNVKPGFGRYYVVNLANGNPAGDTDNDGDIDKQDRYRTLKSANIAAQPKIIFPDDARPLFMVGPEILDASIVPIIDNHNLPSYWYKKPN